MVGSDKRVVKFMYEKLYINVVVLKGNYIYCIISLPTPF